MYRIIELVENEWRITDSLSEKQFEEFNQQSWLISKVKRNIDYFDLLEEEYQAYLSVIENKNSKNTTIIRSVNNYCSGYKGFLDRWETYCKREGSEELIEYFKKTVSMLYDRCFEYRFIYNLRNYAQHAGYPLSTLTTSVEKETKIMIDKEMFISSHTGMQKKFKEELRSLEIDEIDVNAAILVVHQGLKQMHVQFVQKVIELTEEVLYAAYYTNNFYKKYSEKDGALSIITQENAQSLMSMGGEKGITNLTLRAVDHKVAQLILRSVKIRFRIKGKHAGEGNGFPRVIETKNVLEMPVFYSGNKRVMHNNIEWLRIIRKIGTAWRDGYDRLFALYMPAGLDNSVYDEIINLTKKESDTMFGK